MAITDTRIIDSRDLIAELATLDAEDDADRIAAITDLIDAGIEDWEFGATLIRDDYFQEYAQELAEDCGLIPDGLAWPLTCIDWEHAARELKYDYMSYTFDGDTYWVR